MNKNRSTTTNLKKRFFLWSALILVCGGLVLSLFSFWNSRHILMAEAMSKSELLLREVEAIRSYVKDELRPKMYKLHGDDAFIIEAMSTTYVSTTIMERFARTMPNYIYRRASLNPHNSRNLADPFEEEMFDWFEENPDKSFWQGVVKKNDESFFISMVPDYFSQPCIRCHGKVEDAPHSLVERYGTRGGFRFQAGDLAGINSVAVPVSAPLKKAYQGAIVIFLTTLGTTVIWLWLLNLLFGRLVIERLGLMLSLVAEKKEGEIAGKGDELDVLRSSLRSLNRYVRSARKGGGLEPNFIGSYVVKRPVAAGAMSWLYQGHDKNEKPVMLKVGFEEVLQNPLYRSCLETEYHLFENMHHPCLPVVVERLDDVLVLKESCGRSLWHLFSSEMEPRGMRPVFSQLCDLVGALHAKGIVHHDLRPHVVMADEKYNIKLIDMGLAAEDQQPDPIIAAGLGPQGELAYMAPEQIQGRRGDPRSDIYALGVMLYLAVTAQLPFSDEKRLHQDWIRMKEQVVSLKRHNSHLSNKLEPVIIKAMAFDVKKRYQWIEDLWEDLNKYI
ncbi:MAG: DUF3365 domain-containing protein [Thermodesulfobacteriota bacterium]